MDRFWGGLNRDIQEIVYSWNVLFTENQKTRSLQEKQVQGANCKSWDSYSFHNRSYYDDNIHCCEHHATKSTWYFATISTYIIWDATTR